jgi:hypothetical protein
MRTLRHIRGTTIGWVVSWTFSVLGILSLSTVTEAVCNYGWCEGPPPGNCIVFCNAQRIPQFSYYDYDCYNYGEYCTYKYCVYWDSEPGGSCQWVCGNDDVWECGW